MNFRKFSGRRGLRFALLLTLLVALAPWTTRAQEDNSSLAPLIHLQSGSFDPLAGTQLESQTANPAPGEYLVQFNGPVEEAWVSAVETAGGRLYGYIPDFAYIAYLDGPVLEHVRSFPFVRWVGPYAPAYRLSPTLAGKTLGNQQGGIAPEALLTLSVQTLPDIDLQGLSAKIQSLGGSVAAQAVNSLAGYLKVNIQFDKVEELAVLAGVVWVEPYQEQELFNNVAAEKIMNVGITRAVQGLYGKGQVIGIADTGLDTGDLATLHPDFAGRVKNAFCLGRSNPCDWSDPNGHGTHVIGSALGSGAASRKVKETYPYQGSFAGMAPQAQLVIQSVIDVGGKLGGIPDDCGDLMREAYRAGARIHSNSWGGPTDGDNQRGGYSVGSQQVDQAAWELKDMLILFAAGNSGVDPDKDGIVDLDSLMEPGTAKNTLTIGATESLRTSGGYNLLTWESFGFSTPPLRDDRWSDNPSGMAAFSSRGPSDDGRIKPDLVAPGTNILSTRSSVPDPGWGIYNQYYGYMGGTSMSTPLVSGVAALVREALGRLQPNPSSALVKAILINGAANMSPGQYENITEIPSSRPNFVNGWGRVDLQNSLQPYRQQLWFQDFSAGLRTKDQMKYTLALGKPGSSGTSPSQLRVTLAWTDYPGSLTASRALVNDLDLEIIGPDGKHYKGNRGLYRSGHCLRNEVWDACNNVEGVLLADAPYGTYTIIVRGYNIPKGPQPFALVASGEALRDSKAGYFEIFMPKLGKK